MVTLLRLLFWSAAIFAFVMAVLPHPPALPGAPSDKVQHIIAFVCLGLLGSAAYPTASAWKIVVGLSAFGALIEVAQLTPGLHRDAQVLDWVADSAAVIAVVLAIHVWRRARAAR